jgi:propionyl-CoA carboxylase alpha chain
VQLEYILAASTYAHSLQVERAASHFEERVNNAWTGNTDWTVIYGNDHYSVRLLIQEDPFDHDGDALSATMWFGDKTYEITTDWVPGTNLFKGTLNGVDFAVSFENKKSGLYVRHRGVAKRVTICTPRHAELYARLPEKEAPDMSKLIVSPMPGLIVSMDVEIGQEVKAGEGVCVVEAMKMQNIIRAEADAVVSAINVSVGDTVAADAIMVTFE